MDRILWEASFSGDGIANFLDDRNTARREHLAELFARLGGRLEAMYFSFEEGVLYVIADVPDGVPVTAPEPELAALLAGAIQIKSVVLVSPEELDHAVLCPSENAMFPLRSGMRRVRGVPGDVLSLARRPLERRFRARTVNDSHPLTVPRVTADEAAHDDAQIDDDPGA